MKALKDALVESPFGEVTEEHDILYAKRKEKRYGEIGMLRVYWEFVPCTATVTVMAMQINNDMQINTG